MGARNLRVPGTPRPVPKLQQARQEQIMMRDKNLGVPGTGTTMRFRSYNKPD